MKILNIYQVLIHKNSVLKTIILLVHFFLFLCSVFCQQGYYTTKLTGHHGQWLPPPPSLDILIKAHVLSFFIILSCLYLIIFSNSPITTAFILMTKLQFKEAKQLTQQSSKTCIIVCLCYQAYIVLFFLVASMDLHMWSHIICMFQESPWQKAHTLPQERIFPKHYHINLFDWKDINIAQKQQNRNAVPLLQIAQMDKWTHTCTHIHMHINTLEGKLIVEDLWGKGCWLSWLYKLQKLYSFFSWKSEEALRKASHAQCSWADHTKCTMQEGLDLGWSPAWTWNYGSAPGMAPKCGGSFLPCASSGPFPWSFSHLLQGRGPTLLWTSCHDAFTAN